MEQSRQQTEQVEVRTAGALESMVRWIERTDRQRRDELGSLAHAQERTSLALREALTLVTARLDSLEHAFERGRDRELAPVRTALQRLESRIDDLGQREAEGPVPPNRQDTAAARGEARRHRGQARGAQRTASSGHRARAHRKDRSPR